MTQHIKKQKFYEEKIMQRRTSKFFLIFKKYFIYLFLGKGTEKERKRNINVWLRLASHLLGTWSTIQACALNGNQTGDHLVCRLVLNPLSHTSQGSD